MARPYRMDVTDGDTGEKFQILIKISDGDQRNDRLGRPQYVYRVMVKHRGTKVGKFKVAIASPGRAAIDSVWMLRHVAKIAAEIYVRKWLDKQSNPARKRRGRKNPGLVPLALGVGGAALAASMLPKENPATAHACRRCKGRLVVQLGRNRVRCPVCCKKNPRTSRKNPSWGPLAAGAAGAALGATAMHLYMGNPLTRGEVGMLRAQSAQAAALASLARARGHTRTALFRDGKAQGLLDAAARVPKAAKSRRRRNPGADPARLTEFYQRFRRAGLSDLAAKAQLRQIFGASTVVTRGDRVTFAANPRNKQPSYLMLSRARQLAWARKALKASPQLKDAMAFIKVYPGDYYNQFRRHGLGFDDLLVRIKHPIAWDAGTPGWRFGIIVRDLEEIAQRK